MQCLKHRAGHIPVEIVRLEVERVSVCKKVAETVHNLQAVGIAHTDINRGKRGIAAGHETSFGLKSAAF
jgi:predicted Ser/Thr protein kinase